MSMQIFAQPLSANFLPLSNFQRTTEMSTKMIYDAIVVGSGASGGWAAKELTEGGMRVLVLDAGEEPQAKQRYRFLRDLGRKLRYRGQMDQRTLSLKRQPIQSKCHAWDWNEDYFVDDLENPYTTPENAPFTWIRSRQVGGRMVVPSHGRQLYRLSDLDFKAAHHDGYGENWPISYSEVAPYYAQVEQWIGLRGTPEQIPQLPDSLFFAPTSLTPAEKRLKMAVENKWPDRRVIPARTAEPSDMIKAARATGRLALRPNAIASHVIIDPKTGKAKGVAFIDRHSHKAQEVFANVVVLAASTIESTRILLHSATPQHPAGLANASGVVGHYLCDHFLSIDIYGIIGDLDRTPATSNGLYIPQFRNIVEHHPQFIRGYGIQGSAGADASSTPEVIDFRLRAFGEMLPRHENQVTLHPDQKDVWGIPVAHINCTYSDNEREMAKDMLFSLKEMACSANFEIRHENDRLAPPGTGIHEVGTVRMGNDPKTSALNRFNQSWDVKNLFVTDGSCFVSQGCQNPTLTIMALTVRACDYILDSYRKGDL
jgi:choline dehydrogenase-like flavoprotein